MELHWLNIVGIISSVIAAGTGVYLVYLQRTKLRFSICSYCEDESVVEQWWHYYIECHVNSTIFNIERIEIRYNNETIVGCTLISEESIFKGKFRYIFPIEEEEYYKLQNCFKKYRMKYFDVFAADAFGKTRKYKLSALDAFEHHLSDSDINSLIPGPTTNSNTL
ncbi:MAG: hypothetical protein FWG61_01245 [Firmicutes bacterium]|nr:hypothetical protein [Bacillota bacterium]